jgi:signal transduction histidine kinase
MTKALARFFVGGILAMLVLSGILGYILYTTTNRNAVSRATDSTQVIARAVIEPHVTDGLLTGDPAAIAEVDKVVRAGVLGDPIVRVKIWSSDGRIVYSDEPQLIGSAYGLGPDEEATLRGGGADSEITDLSKPENRFENPARKLIEVYVPMHTPSGQPLLYEDYVRFNAVVSSNRTLWLYFLFALVGALVVLEFAQLPLAWSMARRIRTGQAEREALLQRAIDASDTERRRIARDLHDGAVQDLAAVSIGLAAMAKHLEGEGRGELAGPIEDAAAMTRQSVRSLRTLLVDIYPASLHREGLWVALAELLAPMSADGVATELLVPDHLELSQDIERALYRTTQEALRNVHAHADATRVAVQVSAGAGGVTLTVEDNGKGFDPNPGSSTARGHFGLQMLKDLASDIGGVFELHSTPGKGTRLTLRVPTS